MNDPGNDQQFVSIKSASSFPLKEEDSEIERDEDEDLLHRVPLLRHERRDLHLR